MFPVGLFHRPEIPLVSVTLHCDHPENCSWSETDTLERISVISYRYCYPAIGGVGIVGSLLLLLTLCDARFRAAGVYTYLRCLMVSDCAALALATGTLLSESCEPIVFCGGRALEVRSRFSAVWHSVAIPLVNALIGLSMGITLWMTYDRYLAVRVPRELWRQRRPASCCGGRRLRIAATLLVSLLLHMPQVLGYQVVYHCPNGREDFYELLLTDFASSSWAWCAYQWSLQLLVRWLPAAAVLYCNGYIIVAIKRRERRKSAADATVTSCSHVETGDHASERAGSGIIRFSWLTSEARSTETALATALSAGVRARRSRRRREAESRLELLLLAMAAACLVSNCLQSAVIILDMVYKEDGTEFQIIRAVGNNVEALNVSLDFAFALAFVKQIRQAFVWRLRRVVAAGRWLAMVP